ncbi:DUF1842 domain-containing protein [Rhodobacter capsulatus]|uniref:DUF1842 domain-containing protein n=1 Tax=Rhodobacter capsulatus TaxID=1061 RepID=UPI0040263D89
MSQGLYLVTLDFETGMLGAASIQLDLAVDAVHQTLSGSVSGRLKEGTQHPMTVSGRVNGVTHATGLVPTVLVGALQGEVMVAATGGLIGTYLAPFSAQFSVDSDWNGTGEFRIGNDAYTCQVTRIRISEPAE